MRLWAGNVSFELNRGSMIICAMSISVFSVFPPAELIGLLALHFFVKYKVVTMLDAVT